MINGLSSSSKGFLGEWIARLYLRVFGLRHIRSNHRTKSGEIDIIMQHSDVLVFIEVKSRSDPYIQDAIYSIDAQKQQRIIRAAKHFLYCHTQWRQHDIRFDVIIVNLSNFSIRWHRNAFEK